MPRKQRFYSHSNSFAAGLLSEAAIDAVDSELAQMGLSQAENLVILRDGGARTRPAFIRAEGRPETPSIPVPTHSALTAIEPSQDAGRSEIGPISGQSLEPWTGQPEPGRDGFVRWARSIRYLAPRTQSAFSFLAIRIQPGTRPRAITLHGVRIIEGSWQTAGKLSFNVHIGKADGTFPALHTTDRNPFARGVFSPGIVPRDLTIFFDHLEAEPADITHVLLSVPAAIRITTRIELQGFSCFVSDKGTGGVALPDGPLLDAVRVLPWTVSGIPLALVLTPDFIGYYGLGEGQDIPFRLLAGSRNRWHFTARQLRELTMTVYNRSLLLFHHDFPHPIEINPNALRVNRLQLRNVPDLPASLQEEAGTILRITDDGLDFTAPTGLVSIPAVVFARNLNLSVYLTWTPTESEYFDVVWDTAAAYDADPAAWLAARASQITSTALPGSKAVGVNATEYTVSGLTGNTEYIFAVRGRAGNMDADRNSGLTGIVRATPYLGDVPQAQGLTTALGNVDGRLNVSWTASTRAVGGYQAQWRSAATATAAAGAWANVGLGATSTSFVFNAVAGITYDFRVRIIGRDSRAGPWSSTASRQARNLTPAKVMGVTTATAQVDGRITLTWTAVPNATIYQVRWKQQGNFPWSAPQGAGAGGYHFGGVAGTTYDFQVRAIRPFATAGAWSDFVTRQARNRMPAVPTGLSATVSASVDGRIEVRWNAAALADLYQVRYKQQGTTTWSSPQNAGAGGYNFGGAAGTTYEFQVRSVRSHATSSAWSGFVTRLARNIAPAVPGGVSATPSGTVAGRIHLRWNAAARADGYQARVKVQGTTTWGGAFNVAASGWDHDGTIGTTYDYQVRAWRSNADPSGWSAFVSATAPQLAPPAPSDLVNIFAGESEAGFFWLWFLQWAPVSYSQTITQYDIEYEDAASYARTGGVFGLDATVTPPYTIRGGRIERQVAFHLNRGPSSNIVWRIRARAGSVLGAWSPITRG